MCGRSPALVLSVVAIYKFAVQKYSKYHCKLEWAHLVESQNTKVTAHVDEMRLLMALIIGEERETERLRDGYA